jgi:antitoxin component of RelBE/YafQ-DinJ toxin-antitoxin module
MTMTESLVSLNVKISAEEKRRFVETAKAVGLTPSAAIRAFVFKFCECGEMPFELRKEPRINLSHPDLVKARVQDGVVIVPNSWRDEDD